MRLQILGLRPAISLATATIIGLAAELTATTAGAAAIVPNQFNDNTLSRNDDEMRLASTG